MKNLFYKLFLFALAITGILTIFTIWTSYDPDFRMLHTSMVFAVASLLAMSGGIQLEMNKKSLLGFLPIGFSISATLTTLLCIWGQYPDLLLIKITLISWFWSVATSLHSLTSIAKIESKNNWIKACSAISAYATTMFLTLVVFEVIDVSPEFGTNVLVTGLIITALSNISMFILHGLNKRSLSED